jgi:hydroxymethylpyrimidine pyrophosphatase-like HAD family hydrolase
MLLSNVPCRAMQVLPLGASKGAGVSWLLDRLGVAPEAVMALGDGENDVEMLQLAGLGVAVGNAGEAAVYDGWGCSDLVWGG